MAGSGRGLGRAAGTAAALLEAGRAGFAVAAGWAGGFTGRGGLNWGPPRRDVPAAGFLEGMANSEGERTRRVGTTVGEAIARPSHVCSRGAVIRMGGCRHSRRRKAVGILLLPCRASRPLSCIVTPP